MTTNHKPVSAISEILRRGRWMVAGTLALAMLPPSNAFATNGTLRQSFDQPGHVLPLPPVRYLDSMHWMDWKPAAPTFKVDTLRLPDSTRPGIFQPRLDYERYQPHVS